MAKLKMYKVLVFHQKHGDCYVSARTPEEELKAYLFLFNLMDEMGYYNYDGALNADEQVLYTDAKAGDGKSAKWLIDGRYGCEYESVDVEWVTVPE
jgi:hypothetical protein